MSKTIRNMAVIICLIISSMLMISCGSEKAANQAANMTAEEKVAKAMEMLQEPVEDLTAIIGEPNSKDYASSCLGDGQDGTWTYDEFLVYTYKDDTGEYVQYAELKN